MTREFFEGKSEQEIITFLKDLKTQLDQGVDMDPQRFIQGFFNLLGSGLPESRNLEIRMLLSSLCFSFLPKFLGEFTDSQILAFEDQENGQAVLNEIIEITTVQGISYRDHVELAIKAAKESTKL